ncbi:hypothetical protein [Gordonia oryzae]|uniref:hypothetical protein n=1 Tax=Gordonia oryzae TaxID=2487349 RepID=UPI00161EB043|nr:hypothetical protein [Gordonia oryzae]
MSRCPSLVKATRSDVSRTDLVRLTGCRNLTSVKTVAASVMSQVRITGHNKPSPDVTV